MHDVMVKPDHDGEAREAAQTTTVTKYFYYHDKERKAAARESLRRHLKSDFVASEDGMADCALEEIWNLLVGN